MAPGEISWAPWTIVLPLLGATLVVLLGGRRAPGVGIATAALGAGAAAAALARLARVGPERHAVAGWEAPLGIELLVDGWGLGFVAASSVVVLAVALHAASEWRDRTRRLRFWSLLLVLQGGLNALFLSGDLFNLYVTLEVVAVTAAGLAALERKPEAVRAALHYLLLSLAGSFAYLAAVVLVYSEHATLDLVLLAERSSAAPLAAAVAAFATVGLALKTGLFPLHTWLPPAHGGAPAPASALLSGLVVKGSFFVLLRIALVTWPALWDGALAWGIGLVGAAATLWGYGQALRSERLKTLLAYSTVGTVGQLFLVFPLAAAGSPVAVGGVFLLAVSHAFAKGAAFLGVGNVVRATGGDRIEDLAACAPSLPVTQATLAFAALAIVGLPPSAGFAGKWLFLEASVATGQWIWPVVLVAGTLLSGGAMLRVLQATLVAQVPGSAAASVVPRSAEWAPFGLAVLGVALGGLAGPVLAMTQQVGGAATRLVGAP